MVRVVVVVRRRCAGAAAAAASGVGGGNRRPAGVHPGGVRWGLWLAATTAKERGVGWGAAEERAGRADGNVTVRGVLLAAVC